MPLGSSPADDPTNGVPARLRGDETTKAATNYLSEHVLRLTSLGAFPTMAVEIFGIKWSIQRVQGQRAGSN
jgi:hypothetical protein